MKDLIVKLLKENGRVIIPDFGAFIIKTKSPFIVIFNEFLQYNDGALIGAAEEKLKIERDEAAKKVKEYATDIISKLEKGTTINLSEIGILSKSATGKITLSATEADVPKETKEIKEEPAPTVEFDIAETKAKPEPQNNKKNIPEVKKEKVSPPDAKTINKPLEVKKVTPPIVKTSEKHIEEKKDSPAKEPMPISEYYEDNTSRNRRNVILWIILIVLINGTLVGYIFFDDEIKGLFGKNNALQNDQQIDTPEITDENIPIIDEHSTREDELIIEDTSEEVLETEQSSAMHAGKKYYVVAGVFKEETNADNLVESLKQKGYNAEKFGKIGTLHTVSYEVFPTKQEADDFMLKMKREVDSEAWIRIVD